jgi:aromatic-L-amino-acid/L-tryptophan decarboxylase
MLAELLAASLDPNCAGADQAPRELELQVVRWFAEAYGLPAETGGLMVSGGSEANLVCLAAARQRVDPDARRRGVDPARADLVFYGSTEAHFSIGRALEVLGLGADSFRSIPCGDDARIDLDALATAIAQDRAAGRRPAAICANLGTVNTGAVDPVAELADLAEAEGLWLHVDGAFGALLALSDAQRHLTAGLERADSVAFDLHKWAYQPYECACALVRDASLLDDTFGFDAPYLGRDPGGMLDVDFGLAWRGVQLSRGFKALKAWFAIKQEGMAKLGRMIEQNCAQATQLTEWVEADPRLELLAPTVTCVVNFRLHPPGLDDEAALDALNQRLIAHLHHSGLAVPSPTRIAGRYSIRPAFTNHRTTDADLRLFIDAVVGFAGG